MAKHRSTRKANEITTVPCIDNAENIIIEILSFLQLFLCQTLAKRIACMLLLAVAIPNARIAELLDLSERTVRDLKKALEAGKICSQFIVKGGGSKSKIADIEDIVIEEIENNHYTCRQQIADMIYEKHGVKISVSGVGRLLKKKVLNA